MPSHTYQVSLNTITEVVVTYLERHAEVPGVILMDGDRLHGILPRARIFERLSHMYGTELFLRKPILDLQNNIQTRTYTIASNVRIQEAVQIALNRPSEDVYDPLVVHFDDGSLSILDMYALLLAQSQALHSMNNIMSSLALIERAIEVGSNIEQILDLSLDSIRKVIPYHRTIVHVRDGFEFNGRHHALEALDRSIPKDSILRSVLNIGQPMSLDDVTIVPSWNASAPFDRTRSWLGIPLLNRVDAIGVLSLMRHIHSPFSKDEITMTQAFSDLLSRAIDPYIRPETFDTNERTFARAQRQSML
jgi:GAF domain-containing protein